MKRTTQASSTRHARHSELRTQSEYPLVMPEPRPGNARSAPPSPRPRPLQSDRFDQALAVERQLAEEVRQLGGTVPRDRAITGYLHAMSRADTQFVVADPDVVDYLAQLSMELAQEVGTPPRLFTPDIDGQLRPLDRVRGRTVLLKHWDAWAGPQCLATPHLMPYLRVARERFFDGITHREPIDLDDWPVQQEGGHAALSSMYNQVITRAMNEMEWNDIDTQEVGLVIIQPVQLRGPGTSPASAPGHHAEQPSVGVVGEQVQQPVGAFAHIPDAGIDVRQEPLLPHEPALFEHQP